MSHLGSKDFKNREEVRQERADHIQKALYGDIEKGREGGGKSEGFKSSSEDEHKHHSSKATEHSRKAIELKEKDSNALYETAKKHASK